MKEIISAPTSHAEKLDERKLQKFKLSPNVQIIVKKDEIVILENVYSTGYSLCKTDAILELLRKISRSKGLTKKKAIAILKKDYGNNSAEIFSELCEKNIFW